MLVFGAVEKTFTVPSAGLREIQVYGFKGTVRASNDKGRDFRGTWSLKGPGEGEVYWQPIIERKGDVLEIKVVGPTSKADWGLQMPALELDIKGTSLPLVVVWKEGEVALSKWDKATQVTVQKGKISSDGGAEALKLTIQDGDLNILNHSGSIEVDSLAATLSLAKVVGALKISNYSGRLKLSESDGSILLKSFQGKNSIEKTKGALEFEGGRGEITLSSFRGAIQAKMDQGSFVGEILGPVEARIKSESGRVSLAVPRSSGARVDLGTSEGSFAVAMNLSQERGDDMKTLKGRLSGSEEGAIFIRTESGEIRLKTY